MNLVGHRVNPLELGPEDVVQVVPDRAECIDDNAVGLGENLLRDAAPTLSARLFSFHGGALVGKDAVGLQPDSDGDPTDFGELADLVGGLDCLPRLELLAEGVSDLRASCTRAQACGPPCNPLLLWTTSMGCIRGGGMARSWIPVLVDIEDYHEITAMVAERARARGASGASELPAIAVVGPTSRTLNTPDGDQYARTAAAALESQIAWELEDLERLADPETRFETARRWALAMDACLKHIDDPFPFISTEQVCNESGMTLNQWRDAPRKLPAHLAKHYPNVRNWPLAAIEGRKVGRDNQIYWALTQEQAQRWRQVRGA